MILRLIYIIDCGTRITDKFIYLFI